MGSYSGVFNGSNAYLSLADSNDWDFDGDFTIDFWVKWNGSPSIAAFLANIYSASDKWCLYWEANTFLFL